MKVQVTQASVEFVSQSFLRPLLLSSGAITSITEARVTLGIKMPQGEATGRGSIYLSDLWAWPDPSLTHDERDGVLREYCQHIASALPQWCEEPAHPLEQGLRLHHHIHETDTARAGLSLPMLARSMCAAAFDAAIHDGAGQVLGRSAFTFYNEDCPIPGADHLFPGTGTCQAIRSTIRQPVMQLDAWWIVGSSDSLDEMVATAVQDKGYRCFKLKLTGRDVEKDVRRTCDVYRAVAAVAAAPVISVDSNEANPDAASVLEYLNQLKEVDQEAFDALRYLEQPTGRDISQHVFDWHPVSQIKPVLLDEGLTSFDLMQQAVEQGWSGFALKTCKGHSFLLVAAAWAKARGLMLTLQDLTNPGLAAIHAALVAAYIPVANGVELNSPQFTPAANASFLPRLAPLFEPKAGVHRVDFADTPGLGGNL